MSKYIFTVPEKAAQANYEWTVGCKQSCPSAMSLATAMLILCIMMFLLLAVENKKHVYSHAANRLGAR